MNATSTTAPSGPDPIKNLKEQLEAKKQEKAQDDKKGLGDQIKDLEKLVQTAAKAHEGYAKMHDDLKAEQARLETFSKNTEPDLIDIIREVGVAAIQGTVKEKVRAIAAKREEIAKLKGVIPVREADKNAFAIGEVTKAEVALADAIAAHEAATAKVAVYSNLAGGVGARLGGLGKLEKEILKRGQGGQPATAFWLMTRGEPSQPSAPLSGETGSSADASTANATPNETDEAAPQPTPDRDAEAKAKLQALIDALLPKALFFSGGLTAQPQFVPPEQLPDKLSAAWDAEKAAAKAVDKAKKAYAEKADALKAAEKALADLEKGLFVTITDAVAEWDKNRVNPAI